MWLHNAVAEVWIAELIRKMEPERQGSGPLKSLLLEAEAALSHNWLTGVLIDSFERHLQDDTSMARFVLYLMDTQAALLASPADERGVVDCSGRPVSRTFLIPELEMIETLFLHPERVPSPPQRFSTGRGWH